MRNFLKTLCAAAVMVSLCALQSPLSAQVRRTTDSENSSREKSTQVRRTGTSNTSREQVRRTGTTSTERRTTTSSQSGQVRRTGTSNTNREQVRRTGTTSTERRTTTSSQSGQVRRTGTSNTNREQVRRTGTSTTDRRTTTSSQSDQVRHPQGQDIRTNSNTTDGRVIRSNTNVTGGNGLGHYEGNRNSSSGYYRGDDFYVRDSRFDEEDYYDYRIREHNLYRIPPIERNFMRYDRVSYFYGPGSHYFGWKVQRIPSTYRRVTYFGVEYFTYGNVYYRRYRGHYVVCRPPVGITIEASVGRRDFVSVRFSYFPSHYRTYRGFDRYSRYIDRQNRIIAENNALIASQNRMIALNTSSARSSYDIADALGLVQSYAYANREYFYQDGVFYIVNDRGRYEVIVPPAGALVERLPEDYEVIVLNGAEYYRVDDTVYRTVLVYGVPQLEVLGQMYGSLARQHSRYYNDNYRNDYEWDDDWEEDWEDWD